MTGSPGVAALGLVLLAGCATSSEAYKPGDVYGRCLTELRKTSAREESSQRVSATFASEESSRRSEETRSVLNPELEAVVERRCSYYEDRARSDALRAERESPHSAGRTAIEVVSGTAMGVGLVGAGVAGLLYLESSSTANAHCVGSTGACDATGTSAANSATTEAWLAYGGLGLSAVGLVILTYALAKPAPAQPVNTPRPTYQFRLGLAPSGAGLGGSF